MSIKISQLPNLIINQINSSDLIPIVNSNVTKKVTLTDLSKKILGGLQFTSSLSGNTNINIGSENAMSINTSGSIGIGTTTPSYKLHVNGSVAGTSAYNNLSDRREKENIDYNFQYGLSEILLLKPAKFDYLNGEKEHLGFIAQDVNEVIPEIIGSFQKDVNGTQEDRLTIKESSIIPVLVKAIQELTSRLEKLESKKSKK